MGNLKGGYFAAELFPLLHIIQSTIEGSLGNSQGLGRNQDPTFIKEFKHLVKAFPFANSRAAFCISFCDVVSSKSIVLFSPQAFSIRPEIAILFPPNPLGLLNDPNRSDPHDLSFKQGLCKEFELEW